MACSISSNLTITCDALKRVGGLNKRVWLFNISDLATPIVATTDGYVTNIQITTYRNIYKNESKKFTHSLVVNEQNADDDNEQ